jgi:[acyl-carrier-protein] S-malonyltransferase
MGIDLFEADSSGSVGVRALFDQASAILGKDVRDLLNADADTLKRTDVSQVAITVASLAVVRALAAKGVKPAACAGFSLGEYPALAVSGIISVEEAIKLTITRGKIMQEVADKMLSAPPSFDGTAKLDGVASATPGMSAIIGLSPEKVDEVLASIGGGASGSLKVFGANYNSPLQTVISGTSDALDKAEAAFKEAGARRALRLKVAGPFHSPLMAEAGTRFAAELEKVTFRDPAIPVFSNVTGARILTGAEAKKNAVAHISNPVRWTIEESAIAAFMAGANVADLVEVGPGKVLSGLWADSKLAGVCKPYTEILGA